VTLIQPVCRLSKMRLIAQDAEGSRENPTDSDFADRGRFLVGWSGDLFTQVDRQIG
jgi:hypothetical protein